MKKLFLGLTLLLTLIFCLSLNQTTVEAEEPTTETTVNYTYSFNIDGTESTPTTLTGTYGQNVTVDSGTAPEGTYEFVGFAEQNNVYGQLNTSKTIRLTADTEIKYFYKTSGTNIVIFMDANQELIKVMSLDENGLIISSEANPLPVHTSFTKPGLTTTGWTVDGVTLISDLALEIFSTDTIVYVNYDNPGTLLNLTLTNGTISGDAYFNEPVTVTATGTGTFNYWLKDGKIASLNEVYTFTPVVDHDLEAVYTGDTSISYLNELFITLSTPYAITSGYSTYIGQFYLPTGHIMIEYGLIVSDLYGDITLDTPDVEKIRVNKFNPNTDEFAKSLLDNDYSSKNIRAYMVTTDGVALTTTYSFINDNLYISEYGEGSSNNKWIEIYNPNDYPVDLSSYELLLYTNGATTGGSSQDFIGNILAANDVIVIYNGSAVDEVKAEGDIVSAVANFNGNDALALYKDGFLVDQFGVIGTDPGSGWTVGTDDTADNTLVRNDTVTNPVTTWDATEWDAYPIDTFDYIGNHNPTPPNTITINGDLSVMAGATITLSVIYPVNTIKGVTWSSSNDLVATVDINGVVTGVAEGTVTITATSEADTNITDTHIIEISAPITYTVSYEENGGTLVPDESNILEGNTATEPSNPTLTGFAFMGWFTDNETFENEFDFTTPITGDITLYAYWVDESSVVYSSDLFISEYIEGSGTTRAIEIYNNTGGPVDLSSYKITNYYNGNTAPTSAYTYQLSGILQHGQTFVLYHTSSVSAIITAAKTADIWFGSSSSYINFNGDDAIALLKNDVVIDLIGVIGTDPGSAWTAEGGLSTANQTLVRNADVYNPTTIWNSTEWTWYATDTSDYLGDHTVT